jgi:hypothetical protein
MERRKVVVGGVGKCCRGQSVCGDIRHMVTPALALTSVNNINLEVLRKHCSGQLGWTNIPNQDGTPHNAPSLVDSLTPTL